MDKAVKNSPFKIFILGLIITGNLLGAGILALPIQAGEAGMVPFIIGLAICWVMMAIGAITIAKQKIFSNSKTADISALFTIELGVVGKWVATIASWIILYGFLTAYSIGSADIIASLLPSILNSQLISIILFFVITISLTLPGISWLQKINSYIIFLMGICFLILVFLSFKLVQPINFKHHDWNIFFTILPIILAAFYYHNIIPTIYRELNCNFKATKKAILIGAGIGFVMNLVWGFVVIGALPLAHNHGVNIISAVLHGDPSTIPLSEEIHSQIFTIASLIFAVLGMATAFMISATALLRLNKDVISNYTKNENRLLASLLTFIPPLFIAIIFADGFIKAVGIVGGFGVGVTFGLLPAILIFKQTKKILIKFASIILFFLFLTILGVEFTTLFT